MLLLLLCLALTGIGVSSGRAQDDAVTPSPAPTLPFAFPTPIAPPAEASPTASAGDSPVTTLSPPTFLPPVNFAATLTARPQGTPTPTPQPVFPIRPGTIEGSISDAAPSARYSFEASADQSVTLRMETTSGNLDPFLTLFGPDGAVVGRNDDLEPGNRNAQIALTLTQSGTYIVEASRFSQGGTGSAGTFRLSLTLSGAQIGQPAADPLTAPPPFAVDFTIINFQDVSAGSLTVDAPRRFYAIGARQGDLVRAILTRTSGDLEPQLRILNRSGEDLSRTAQTRAGEAIAYATLPETGWYLVEAGAVSGLGSFDLFVNRFAASVLSVGEAITGAFAPEAPTTAYIINARIGDQITINMFTEEGSAARPELTLLDLSLREIARAAGDRFVTLRATVPRSGLYILQATSRTAARGAFNLRLSSLPLDFQRLTVLSAAYNDQYSGTITPEAPIAYYRFAGKTGELVTLTLEGRDGLDPFLMLLDADLNELAANDDISTSRDARITFRLPKDGDYLIAAARSGLTQGVTQGAYTLTITAGEIALQAGAVTATLQWASGADLNLYVRDPFGRTVSWSSASVPSGGLLQIDSNTRCTTPSAQPVEHIYWPPDQLVAGDYDVWVWYSDPCGAPEPVPFTLTLRTNGEETFSASASLNPGQRFETRLRVTDTGESGMLNAGMITNPGPQQTASESGDILIRYGENVTGTLNNDRYALFYQFNGQAGDQIAIYAETIAGNLDPIILLRDGDDRTLPGGVNDDASAETRNSFLAYTLPTNGTYIIAVTRFGVRDGTTVGDFRLRLERTGAVGS